MNDSHSRWLRGGRQSEPWECFSVTKCVEGRRPALAKPRSSGVVIGSLAFLRENQRMRLLGFCIMPDHVHLLLILLPANTLQELLRDFSRFTARKLNTLQRRTGAFWQEGFHDRRCRDESEMIDLLAYIEHNPVRAGLVSRAEDWPFSSAHPQHKQLLDRDWYAMVR